MQTSGVKEWDLSIPWTDKQADLGAPEQHAVRTTLHEIADHLAIRAYLDFNVEAEELGFHSSFLVEHRLFERLQALPSPG